MATCCRLDPSALGELQKLFRPFSHSIASLCEQANLFQPGINCLSDTSWRFEDCRLGRKLCTGVDGTVAQHGTLDLQRRNQCDLRLLDPDEDPLCNAAPSKTESFGARAASSQEGLLGATDAALGTPLRARCASSDPDSIPASVLPVNMVPQTCFEASFVPGSVLDSAGVPPSTGSDPEIASAGCGALLSHSSDGNPAFHLQHVTMVPETCFDDIDWLQPQLQLPASLLQTQPQLPTNSGDLTSLAAAGNELTGINGANITRAEDTLVTAPVHMTCTAAATTANMAVLCAAAPMDGASMGLVNRFPERLGQDRQLLQLHEHHPATAAPLDATQAIDVVAHPLPTCDARVLPVPPPGYSFDVDAAPDPGFGVAPTQQTPQLDELGRHLGNMPSSVPGARSGQLPAVMQPSFDYMLDEPTPPPKQLPKGTRLLKPGQRARPLPPPSSAMPPARTLDGLLGGANAAASTTAPGGTASLGAEGLAVSTEGDQRRPEQEMGCPLRTVAHEGFGYGHEQVTNEFIVQDQLPRQPVHKSPRWQQLDEPREHLQQQQPTRQGQQQLQGGGPQPGTPRMPVMDQVEPRLARPVLLEQPPQVQGGGAHDELGLGLPQHLQQQGQQQPTVWDCFPTPDLMLFPPERQGAVQSGQSPCPGQQQRQYHPHQQPQQLAPQQPGQWRLPQPPEPPIGDCRQLQMHQGREQQQQRQDHNYHHNQNRSHQQQYEHQNPSYKEHQPTLFHVPSHHHHHQRTHHSYHDPQQQQHQQHQSQYPQYYQQQNHQQHHAGAPPLVIDRGTSHHPAPWTGDHSTASWEGKPALPQPHALQQPGHSTAQDCISAAQHSAASAGGSVHFGSHIHPPGTAAFPSRRQSLEERSWQPHQQRQPLSPQHPQQQLQLPGSHGCAPSMQQPGNYGLPPTGSACHRSAAAPSCVRWQEQHQHHQPQALQLQQRPAWHPQQAMIAGRSERQPSPPPQHQLYHAACQPQQQQQWQQQLQQQHQHQQQPCAGHSALSQPLQPQSHGHSQAWLQHVPNNGRRDPSPQPPPAGGGLPVQLPPPPQVRPCFPQHVSWESRGQLHSAPPAVNSHTPAPPQAQRQPLPALSANTPFPRPYGTDLHTPPPALPTTITGSKQPPGPSSRQAQQQPLHHAHASNQLNNDRHIQHPQSVRASPAMQQSYGGHQQLPHGPPPTGLDHQRQQPPLVVLPAIVHGGATTPHAATRNLTDASAHGVHARFSGAARLGQEPGTGPGSCGFRTAADKPIHLSDAARQRAAAFWVKVLEEPETVVDGGGVAGEAVVTDETGRSVQQQHGKMEARNCDGRVSESPGGSAGSRLALPAPPLEIPPTVPLLAFEDVEADSENVGPLGNGPPPTGGMPLPPPPLPAPLRNEAQAHGAGTDSITAFGAGAGLGTSDAAAVPGISGMANDKDCSGDVEVGFGSDGSHGGGSGFIFASGRRPQVSAAAMRRGAEVLAKALTAAAVDPSEGCGAEDAGMSHTVAKGASEWLAAAVTEAFPAHDAGVAQVENLQGRNRPDGGVVALAAADGNRFDSGTGPAIAVQTPCGDSGAQAAATTGPSVRMETDPAACGFSTAAGRPVVISEAARKRAAGWLAKILDEDDTEERESRSHGGKLSAGVDAGPFVSGPDENRIADSRRVRPRGAFSAVSAQGGSARRGAVGATVVAASTAAAVLSTAGSGGLSGLGGGFSTAAGAPVAISDAARKRAASWWSKVLQDQDNGMGMAECSAGCGGEQDAKGAAAGADVSGSVGIGGQTMAAEAMAVAAATGGCARNRTDSPCTDAEAGRAAAVNQAGPIAPIGEGFPGFSTAGGRPVVVSEAARQRAAGWMAKILNEEPAQGPGVDGAGGNGSGDGSGMATGSGGAAQLGDAPSAGAAATAGQGGDDPATATAAVAAGGSFGGFSTAGGRPVVVSEAARQRAAGWLAKVLKDECSDGDEQDVRGAGAGHGDSGFGGSTGAAGFSAVTAGAKMAGGSASGMGPPADLGMAAAAGAVGFSTAGGRPVVVSEAARKRAAGWIAKVLDADDGNHGDQEVCHPSVAAAVAAGMGSASGLVKAGPKRLAPRPSPRGDGSEPSFKPPVRCRVTSAPVSHAAAMETTGPSVATATAADAAGGYLATAEGHLEGATAAAHAPSAALHPTHPPSSGTQPSATPATSTLTSPLLPYPRPEPPQPQRNGEVREAADFAGVSVPVGLARRLLPAASVVALPPAATALPRSGLTFASGRPVVLSEEARRSAAAWLDRDCESGAATAAVAAPDAHAQATTTASPAGTTAVIASAVTTPATAGARTDGDVVAAGLEEFAEGRIFVSKARVEGSVAVTVADPAPDEAGVREELSPPAAAGRQNDGEKKATTYGSNWTASASPGLMTAGGKAIAVNPARLAAAAAMLQAVGAVATDEGSDGSAAPSPLCAVEGRAPNISTTRGGGLQLGPRQDLQHLQAQSLKQQLQEQPATATLSAEATPVAARVAAAPTAPLLGALMTAGGKSVLVSEERRRAAEAMLASAATAAEVDAGEEAGPGCDMYLNRSGHTTPGPETGIRCGPGARPMAPEGTVDMTMSAACVGRDADSEVGGSRMPLAPRQLVPALSAALGSIQAGGLVAHDINTGRSAVGNPIAAAGAAAGQHTPMRSLPQPSAAAAPAAPAAAATPPRAVTPRTVAGAVTRVTGLRGPAPSTGGLKRPRAPGDGGSGAAPTPGTGRPPRHTAAATAGGKRKFVSPLPAGYKGKPGAVDCATPLGAGPRGDSSPAAEAWSAGGGAAGIRSAKRCGNGTGSPKRPRLSSLFELEVGIGGAATKLPLRQYFSLPPTPPGASPLPNPQRGGGGCGQEQPPAVDGCGGGEAAGGAGGDGDAAVHGCSSDAVAAAVAAVAPSQFAPLTQAVLDGITAATAAEFKFWVIVPAPPPQAPAPPPPPAAQEAQQKVSVANGGGSDGGLGGGGGGDANGGGGGGGCAAAERVAWGAAEAREVLQQLEVLPRSARERATDPWVTNHYRWIVWKLAAYERRPLPGSQPDARGSLGPAAAPFAEVMRQVAVELVGGGRPILAAILAHDRPAGLPMVLAISGLPELSGRSHFTEGMRVELTDGWYGIAAGLDGHLAQLVLSGRLTLGSKLRVCGADLQSERPGEPLDPATRGSSALRLHFNGCSPVPWDARLGAQVQPAALALRPLGQVMPGGGAVPATLLLVVAKYGTLTYENTPQGVVNRTPRAQEERLRGGAAQRNEAAAAAAAAVQRAELDRCRALLRGGPRAAATFSSACSASFATLRVQRAYATMVVRGAGGPDGGGGGEEGGGGEDGGGGCGALPAEEQAQLSRLVSERQAYLAAEVARQTEETLNGKSGGAGGLGSGGGGDCGVPYLRLRVAAVTPHGVPSGPPSNVMLRIWRPPAELDEQLREGQVLLATNLTPGAYGSTSGGGSGAGKDPNGGSAAALADLGPHGRLRCLELTASKMTRFRILGQAADLSHHLALPAYQPRRQLRLADIAAALPAALQQRLFMPSPYNHGHLHGHGPGQQDRDGQGALSSVFEFDFTGCVVRVGDVQMVGGGGGVRQQWVFLADQTSGLCAGAMVGASGGGGGGGGGGGEANGGGGGGAGPQPWMLAVKLVGAPESVDFLQDPARQPGAVLSFRHLMLQDRDAANQLWVAAAPDTASVVRVAPPPSGGPGGGAATAPPAPRGGDPVLAWVRGVAGREQLVLYGAKIDRLLGGG
ncbi:BRCA2-like protein [Volvox carteri f. nagariensis]|uniref:BRCA2-like protein n=1 Tax=Volvox carteri f. nagariensis TaxID=3068 RepID=D8TMZ6_VOLCA|nr:BRCA2-like protein [Volvox carteri f. nagariensis]EFJ51213.1 BRCA2-like protein [Volvox carteri f. nagariensis]|eukprot:XP_002947680.1 BRCA2-like protein [Volvox carteri f. nagariensis]